jgi:MFS family permease
MTPARVASVALGATLAIQVFVAMTGVAAAVLAPAIAADFHVAPRWIGAFVGLVYAGAMAASLASGGFIERYGSIRTSQACVAVCAAGMGLMAVVPADAPLWLAGVALFLGVGYGPITPASSHLLARTTAPGRMALTFSIKQTGVPAGAALSGALLPTLAEMLGWRVALAALALLGLVIGALSQLIRLTLDADRRPGRPLSIGGVLAPLAHLRKAPVRRMAIVGLAYSCTQTCLTSFLVVYLSEVLGYPLVLAGFALSVATLAGVAGRIAWGAVADRWLPPRATLALIGSLAGLGAVGMALGQPTWPAAAMLALAAFFGGTAIGWNGVQLAEVARHAPPGAAGAVTGAASFVTFFGVVIGPPLFAALASATGSYRASFVVIGAASAATAGWLAWSRHAAG